MATEVEQFISTRMDRKVEDSGHEMVKEISLKHPLHCTWSLWYFKQEKGKDWSENQKKIASFSTVEDFWALFNHIQPASRLALGCDYSLFKEGIRPMWEDDRNKSGGRWLMSLHNHKAAEQLWMEMVFCLVGEAFEEHSDEICGAVINVRMKCDKLGLWTRDCHLTEENMKIGKILKSRLNIGKELPLEYQPHHESSSKSGSTARSTLFL